MPHGEAGPSPIAQRRAVMALCAEADAAELRRVFEALGSPVSRDLRAPEIGLAMLRGRMGGDGAAFNLGEATVTRAAVEVEGVGMGFAYHLGRNPAKARGAAVVDALWQAPEKQADIERALAPVRDRLESERARAARHAAATRVNFFTLVRGED